MEETTNNGLPEPISTWVATKVLAHKSRKNIKEDLVEVRQQKGAALKLDFLERLNKVRTECKGASEEEVIAIVSNTLGKPKQSIYEHISAWKDLKFREVERQRDRLEDRVQAQSQAKDEVIQGMFQQLNQLTTQFNTMATKMTAALDRLPLPPPSSPPAIEQQKPNGGSPQS